MLVECGQRNIKQNPSVKKWLCSEYRTQKIASFVIAQLLYVNLYLIGWNKVSIWLLFYCWFACVKCIYYNITYMFMFICIYCLIWITLCLIIFYINKYSNWNHIAFDWIIHILCFLRWFSCGVFYYIESIYEQINCWME